MLDIVLAAKVSKALRLSAITCSICWIVRGCKELAGGASSLLHRNGHNAW
jgi:hypothetical protein